MSTAMIECDSAAASRRAYCASHGHGVDNDSSVCTRCGAVPVSVANHQWSVTPLIDLPDGRYVEGATRIVTTIDVAKLEVTATDAVAEDDGDSPMGYTSAVYIVDEEELRVQYLRPQP
ncbi:hypothetical protein [Gordonia otitidis]|nr:hypothetical protein [Gordonia otitidis]